MKKEQKIIEINEKKNIELAKLRSDHASCCAYYAAERYTVKSNYAKLLQGVTDENKRGDLRADRAMKIAEIDMKERASKAMYEREVAELLSSTAAKKAAATDDPEPENQQPAEVPVVWLNGHQHTAVIVARRMLRKLPHIAQSCTFDFSIRQFGEGVSIELQAYNPKREGNCFENVILRSNMTAEEQEKAAAEWLERAAALIKYEDNSHVAEPLSRALDAIFGGNSVKEVDNLISDTVKNRKEGENE